MTRQKWCIVQQDLTKEERDILYQDAIERLSRAGIKLEDVENDLDIWEE